MLSLYRRHLARLDRTAPRWRSDPHNPSGRVFTREELEAVADVALRHDLVVISDEIHQDLVWKGHRHVPFASLGPEVEARTLTLTAASKAVNIAGLRCAVAIFGSDALKRRFCTLPRHLRGGIGLLGIEALRAAWRHSGPWLEQVRAYLEENRADVARLAGVFAFAIFVVNLPFLPGVGHMRGGSHRDPHCRISLDHQLVRMGEPVDSPSASRERSPRRR